MPTGLPDDHHPGRSCSISSALPGRSRSTSAGASVDDMSALSPSARPLNPSPPSAEPPHHDLGDRARGRRAGPAKEEIEEGEGEPIRI
jgi:hypothetical protein